MDYVAVCMPGRLGGTFSLLRLLRTKDALFLINIFPHIVLFFVLIIVCYGFTHTLAAVFASLNNPLRQRTMNDNVPHNRVPVIYLYVLRINLPASVCGK